MRPSLSLVLLPCLGSLGCFASLGCSKSTTAGGAGIPGAQGGSAASAGGSTGRANSAGAAVAYPLKLGPGGRALVDQNGKPFLLVGDTAWSLFVSLSTADADSYLADRQARGYNTVVVNLIEHKFAANPPLDAAGAAPFTKMLSAGNYDFSAPNEAYFAHVDSVINAAAARGIQIVLVSAYLGYSGGDQGWYTEMQANGGRRLTSYGTYLGNRYKSFPNILWAGGGDYNPPDASLTNAVETAIKATDPNHLHTAHCDTGTAAAAFWGSASWLDVDTIYDYPTKTVPIHQAARQAYARTPARPFFLIESSYANSATLGSAAQFRRQAYEALLNGGVGQVSGDEWVWPFGAPGVDGRTRDWKQNLATQGAEDMSRLARLFGSRNWSALAPDVDHAFMTAGASSGESFASASVATDGRLAIVYTPASRALTFNLAKLVAPITARWYDPSNGSFTTVRGSPLEPRGSMSFTSPGNNAGGGSDWVLVFETGS